MSNSTRSSSSNSYDERFVVPLEASRRGAHRARVSPVMAAVPVVAVVGIVVGAIGLVYFFFGGLGGPESATGPAAAPAPAASSAPAASETPAASESGTPTESPSSAGAAGTVDKTITVNVYNGTTPLVSGLARTAATKLTKAGWTTGEVQTWTKAAVTETTIFYGSADQKASAQSLAKTLGRGAVKLSASKAGPGIAVVIGNDFPGANGSRKPTREPGATATSKTTSTRSAGGATTTPPKTSAPADPTPTPPADDPSPTPTN